MKDFDFRAFDRYGKTHTGHINASNKSKAAESLQQKGLIPQEVVPTRKFNGKVFQAWRSPRRRVRQNELSTLTDQLAALLSAGLPLDRALSLVRNGSQSTTLAHALSDVYERVRGGASLSEALARHSQSFSAMFCSMVKAGEASGALHLMLARLSDYITRTAEFHRKVSNALIYPVILILTVAFALCFLMAFVVPQFAEMYANLRVEIPWFTQIVLGLGLVINRGWPILAAFGVISLVVSNIMLKRPSTMRWVQVKLLRTPILGSLIAKIEVERYLRTLSTLMSGGVHITSALNISHSVFSNAWFQQHARIVEERVRRGIRFSDAWEDAKFFPQVPLQIASVGEEAGQLDSMLLKGADMLSGEISTQLERTLGALVPVVTFMMFLLIGGTVMSILVPLYDLTSVIQ